MSTPSKTRSSSSLFTDHLGKSSSGIGTSRYSPTGFFTKGVIRNPAAYTPTRTATFASNNSANGAPYFKEDSKINFLRLWHKSKSETSVIESPDANANISYDSKNKLPFHLPNFGIYETTVNFANQVFRWNRNLLPFWQILLTYPSDLHFIARATLLTIVTGIVVNKSIEELGSCVDLQELRIKMEKVLEHNLLDGTDPNDLGKIGVTKDFM